MEKWGLWKKIKGITLLLLLFFVVSCQGQITTKSVPIQIEHHSEGAPQLLGIPFPKGELHSPDNVRLTDLKGNEIPAQVTEVTSWKPADPSIKWIWVFFFAEEADQYRLEYGDRVTRTHHHQERISVTNNQRTNGYVQVDTGPLRFRINKGEGGFFEKVELDTDGDGFDEKDVIAVGEKGRSTFMDLLDDAGIDRSKAIVHRTVKEKGTGPLHAVIRVEGEYRYSRDDNNAAPFVTRIHAYAGKSYLRILHTFVYTGDPDKHEKVSGEYDLIATGADRKIIDQLKLKGDPGWTEPNDRIAAAGFSLNYNLSDSARFTAGYYDGNWWQPGDERIYTATLDSSSGEVSVLQTGPKPTRVPPLPNSTSEERLSDDFSAELSIGSETKLDKQRASGWIDVSDNKWGVTVGFRSFFQEYPKELSVNASEKELTAYIWSQKEVPMSFERATRDFDSQLVANFAQGLAKTTELVYNFHSNVSEPGQIQKTANYVLDPPVSHTESDWYAKSEVFGKMAASSTRFPEFERGLDYKFQWWSYNQQWEPWYGMLDYGDGLTYYFRDDWYMWTNNEPATDYMWWLQFMRTGNRDYYLNAQATSRHTMDVDNVHWPQDPEYVGDTNASLDAFEVENQPAGSPYVGMGRRHARQHYTALLSAHVWVPGWIASYFLEGNHRGLEVAELTGDYYIKRVFGEHGLRGRRLYLSVWNLSEIWDATKKKKYFKELKDRADLMLRLQNDADQGGSLVIDRYGYSQVYASHGLKKYYQMTGDERIKDALVTHARWVRDVPPRNHQMESYLSSIHSLLLGYEFTGEDSFIEEAVRRAEVLKTDQLEKKISEYSTQAELARALNEVSNLPGDPTSDRPAIWKITNGLRIFGWTHIYNVPYLVYWLEREGYPNIK